MTVQISIPQMPAPKQQPDLLSGIMQGMAAAHSYSQMQDDERKAALAPILQHIYETQSQLGDIQKYLSQKDADFHVPYLTEGLKQVKANTAQLWENVTKEKLANQATRVANDALGKKAGYGELMDFASTANNPNLPDDRKQQLWDLKRGEIAKYSPALLKQVPTTYLGKDGKPDPYFQPLQEMAKYESPQEADKRKLDMEKAKSGYKMLADIDKAAEIEKIKDAAKPDPRAQEGQKKLGDADADYSKNITNDAIIAQKMTTTLSAVMASSEKAGTGFLSSMLNYMTAEGNLAKKTTYQYIMDEFGEMKHIGRGGNLMLRFLEGGKPSEINTMGGKRLIINLLEFEKNRQKEKLEFDNYLSNKGITNFQQKEILFQRYEDAYVPLKIMDKDKLRQAKDSELIPNIATGKLKIQMKNLNNWRKFLAENPEAIDEVTGQKGK